MNSGLLIKKLRKLRVVRKGPVKLKYAGDSAFYIDIKKAFGYPEILNLLCDAVGSRISRAATCLAASGYGGLPLAAALSSRCGLKLSLVRDKCKTHGRNVWIDGYLPGKKDNIIIIDDVLTTGNSLMQIIKVLTSTKAKILKCVVVVKRGRAKLSVPVSYVLTAQDLL